MTSKISQYLKNLFKKFASKFYFGEKVEGYEVRVLNEREVRGASGILFALALTSFWHAFVIGNFEYLRTFAFFFVIDFTIRIFVSPKYSPTLVVSRFVVRNQVPEYVGAPQKRFAWFLGLIMAFLMLNLITIYGVYGPVNLVICLICLTLLFLETSFGICMGCKMYNLIFNSEAKYCPGGVCEYHPKQEIQKINATQVIVLILVILFVWVVYGSELFSNRIMGPRPTMPEEKIKV
jgi:hypothetical protein